MGPGEDGTGPLDLGAYWVSPINTNKTQFLTSLPRLAPLQPPTPEH